MMGKGRYKRPIIFIGCKIFGLIYRSRFFILAPMEDVTDDEQPIVAHIWGNKPALFERMSIDMKKLGFSGIDEWHDWLAHILKQDIANLSIHLRTKKEMSKVDAHWELIPEI